MSARSNGPCGMHTASALRAVREVILASLPVPNPPSSSASTPSPPRSGGEGRGEAARGNTGQPFFRTPDRILRLNLAVAKWRGTPWRANSMAVGVGVSCHNLPRALYAESHFAELPQIISTPHEATASNQMETWLDSRPEFSRIQLSTNPPIQLAAGDLLGMFLPIDNVGKRIRKPVVNHLGVLLPNNFFAHTLMKKNTDLDLVNVPPWSQTLVAAWRPMERV